MNKSLEETDPDLFDIMEHEKVRAFFFLQTYVVQQYDILRILMTPVGRIYDIIYDHIILLPVNL